MREFGERLALSVVEGGDRWQEERSQLGMPETNTQHKKVKMAKSLRDAGRERTGGTSKAKVRKEEASQSDLTPDDIDQDFSSPQSSTLTKDAALSPSITGQTGNLAPARYSGLMDVSTTSIDSISIESLLNKPELRISDSSAQSQLTVLGQVSNGLDVAIAEEKVKQKAITLETEKVNTGTKAYKYSTAVSKFEDARDEASHENLMTDIRKRARASKRTVAVGKEMDWRNKAKAATSRMGRLREVNTDFGEPSEVIDVEMVG